MNKHLVDVVDYDAVRKIKQALTIPVFANGGVFDDGDFDYVIERTGCDGVMSSEGVLCNPLLFTGGECAFVLLLRFLFCCFLRASR
jgi:tRNA-dihydrouridine synthase 1